MSNASGDWARRVAELQRERDELLMRVDELVEAHRELRVSAVAKPQTPPPQTGEADSVRSRFSRFVDEVTDKTDWRAEALQLRQQLDASTKANEAALNAAQLNIRLLQEANRSMRNQARSAPSAATAVSCDQCPQLRQQVNELERRLRAMKSEDDEKEQAFQAALADALAQQAGLEEEIAALRQNRPQQPPPAQEQSASAERELAQVAMDELKQAKADAAAARRRLGEQEAECRRLQDELAATRANGSEEVARVSADLEAARGEIDGLREQESALRHEIDAARAECRDATAAHEVELRKRDAALRELRALVAQRDIESSRLSPPSRDAAVQAVPKARDSVRPASGVSAAPEPHGRTPAASAQAPPPSAGTPQRSGRLGGLRSWLGRSGAKADVHAAELHSAPMQKLRSVLQETLEENLRLAQRVEELELACGAHGAHASDSSDDA